VRILGLKSMLAVQVPCRLEYIVFVILLAVHVGHLTVSAGGL